MVFPERFSNLPEYAFPRLRALLDHHIPGGDVIPMSIGEPKHAFPDFVGDVMASAMGGFAKYPPNDGSPELREAIAAWIARRYGATLDPDRNILPLNGTREGLFNAALALSPEAKNGQKPAILIPNPFYQCYAVAALAAGAEPVFLPTRAETDFLPDFAAIPEDVLARTTIVYLCSPSNPQGAVADRDYWRRLLHLAEQHDFIIFADECYSEIYRDDPPPGILELADNLDRVIAFHSLSKRSNLPGLRSGFAAGGAGPIAEMKQLRNYTGAPLPLPVQAVSAAVWADEAHVRANRALYREKYAAADAILGDLPGYQSPRAGFFVWLDVGDGEAAALRIWTKTGVRVLPGKYLSRAADGGDPGAAFIRIALVAEIDDLSRGLRAIRTCL